MARLYISYFSLWGHLHASSSFVEACQFGMCGKVSWCCSSWPHVDIVIVWSHYRLRSSCAIHTHQGCMEKIQLIFVCAVLLEMDRRAIIWWIGGLTKQKPPSNIDDIFQIGIPNIVEQKDYVCNYQCLKVGIAIISPIRFGVHLPS